MPWDKAMCLVVLGQTIIEATLNIKVPEGKRSVRFCYFILHS